MEHTKNFPIILKKIHELQLLSKSLQVTARSTLNFSNQLDGIKVDFILPESNYSNKFFDVVLNGQHLVENENYTFDIHTATLTLLTDPPEVGKSLVVYLYYVNHVSSGVPIGTKLDFFGTVIPPGYLGLYDAPYTISRAMYPEAVDALWCGAGYNPDADYFYRCDNPDGSGRNEEGQYLLMPIGDGYFVRGRDSSGTVHPYQYQADAFQGHKHFPSPVTYIGGNAAVVGVGSYNRTFPEETPGSIPTPEYGMPRLSNETRPKNLPVARYIIKAWDVATDPGTVDIQEVLTAISVIGAAKTNRSEVFGIDQAWRDVTDMRALNTPYLNESKKPILLYLEATQTVTSGSGRFHVTIDDVVFRTTPAYGSSAPFSCRITVNPGSTYTVTVTASGYNSLKWMEYR